MSYFYEKNGDDLSYAVKDLLKEIEDDNSVFFDNMGKLKAVVGKCNEKNLVNSLSVGNSVWPEKDVRRYGIPANKVSHYFVDNKLHVYRFFESGSETSCFISSSPLYNEDEIGMKFYTGQPFIEFHSSILSLPLPTLLKDSERSIYTDKSDYESCAYSPASKYDQRSLIRMNADSTIVDNEKFERIFGYKYNGNNNGDLFGIIKTHFKDSAHLVDLVNSVASKEEKRGILKGLIDKFRRNKEDISKYGEKGRIR